METEFNAVTSSLVLIINLILIGQKNYIYIFILLFLLFTNALSEPKLEVEVALFCSVPWPSVHHLPCPALLCPANALFSTLLLPPDTSTPQCDIIPHISWWAKPSFGFLVS